VISKKWLVQVTESSIDNLVKTFMKMPYFFYTENDLHTCLYHEIYSKLPLEEWKCTTRDGHSSILLHKEYPTKERYSAKALKAGVSKGARGHFDLSIWNPEKTSNRVFRVDSTCDIEDEQQTFIAIEFDMIEGNRTFDSALHHFKWDLLKLVGEKNEVEHGYQLVFARDWQNKGGFIEQARNEVANKQNTTVLYIEKDNVVVRFGTLSPKLFLDYRQMPK
jgi:hypothetical protein